MMPSGLLCGQSCPGAGMFLRTTPCNPVTRQDYFTFVRHVFVPISWMCKKQTAVSHSSTESEIISLDAGLRLDGIPALDSLDLIFLSLETRFRLLKDRRDPLSMMRVKDLKE